MTDKIHARYSDMHRINFFASRKQMAALKNMAEESGVTYSEHLRRAIDAYLKKNEASWNQRAEPAQSQP